MLCSVLHPKMELKLQNPEKLSAKNINTSRKSNPDLLDFTLNTEISAVSPSVLYL